MLVPGRVRFGRQRAPCLNKHQVEPSAPATLIAPSLTRPSPLTSQPPSQDGPAACPHFARLKICWAATPSSAVVLSLCL